MCINITNQNLYFFDCLLKNTLIVEPTDLKKYLETTTGTKLNWMFIYVDFVIILFQKKKLSKTVSKNPVLN